MNTGWVDDLLDGTAPPSPVTLVEFPDGSGQPPSLVLSGATLTPLTEETLPAELAGTVAVGGVGFEIVLQVPSLQYAIRRSPNGTGWPLDALLSDLGLVGLGLDGLTISDMVLSGSLRTGLFEATVTFDAGTQWTPASGTAVPLTLSEVTVTVGTSGGVGGAYAGISGSATIGGLLAEVGGSFAADGWELVATFNLDDGQADPVGALLTDLGWDAELGFPASRTAADIGLRYSSPTGTTVITVALDTSTPLAPGTPLALGSLLSDLVAEFSGGPSLDASDFFDRATLTGVDVSFAGSKGGDVVLDVRCAGRLGFDGREATDATPSRDAAVVDLSIGLRRASSGTIEATFDGTMRIGGDDPVDLELAVGYDTSTTTPTTTVVGTYGSRDDATAGRPLDLTALVPSEVLLPEIELDVEYVVLAWRKDEHGSRYVVSMAVTATAGIQAEVPVVGRLFPDPGLSIRCAVIGSSGVFADGEVDPINEVLRARGLGELPPTLSKGMNVAGMLDLGLEQLPLDTVEPAESTHAGTGLDAAPATAPDGQTKWLAVQRGFGPVHLARVGIGYADGELTFRLDASIGLAGLELSLDGLGLRTPLQPLQPEVVLTGLGIAYASDTVAVGGSFVKQGEQFAGSAVIRTKAFSLAALGAYQQVAGEASLFVFAAVSRDFGGPPAFYVTGLALGFGYNRDFVPPALEDVEQHPFLTALGSAGDAASAAAMLGQLGGTVPARVGSYWLAAGIRFQSFGIVHSKAVALVRLGDEVEILLLGLAELTLPRGSNERPYVRAELALTVKVKPAAGIALAEAMLTDDSYVIDPACRITGRFAFALWYAPNVHNGDFVLTLGGYHPRFRPPDHYPAVPRIGLSWQNGPITIKGEAYFALTPSCVMAGGQLEAIYRDGALMAAFVLQAHFLISWNPFAYDVEIGVTVRAEFAKETFLGTIRLGTTLGAQVHVWGPEFAGTARVNWSVLTFDVEFGAIESGPPADESLTWDEFRAAYLPADESVCEIQIASGLRSTFDPAGEARTEWIVDPDLLVITTRAAIPSTAVELVTGTGAEQPIRDLPLPRDQMLGIQPMGPQAMMSVHRVSLTSVDTGHHVDLVASWTHQGEMRQAVPKELWSHVLVERAPSADVLEDRIVGLSGLRPIAHVGDGPDAFPLSWFASQPLVERAMPLPVGPAPDADDGPAIDSRYADMFALVAGTIGSATVDADRVTAIERIRQHGFLAAEPSAPVVPTLLAVTVRDVFASSPMLGGEALGSPTRPTHDVATANRPIAVDLTYPPLVFRLIVELLAEITERRYVEAGAPSGGTTAVTTVTTPTAGAIAVLSDDETTAPESVERHLAAGTAAVFQLSPVGAERADSWDDLPTANLELGGDEEVTARVVTLDRFGEVISDGIETGTVPVPLPQHGLRAVARVVVSARRQTTPSGEAGSAYGWHGSSSLVRVAPRRFLTDGGTVEVQAEDAHGVAAVRGSAMVRTNRVRRRATVSGTPTDIVADEPGWVRTTLPPGVQTIAVYVQRDAAADGGVAAAAVEVTDPNGETLRLVPAHIVHESASEVALLYRVPDSVRSSGERVTCLSHLDAGPWTLNGVTAHDRPPQRVRERWQPGVTGLTAPPTEAGTERRLVRLVGGTAA